MIFVDVLVCSYVDVLMCKMFIFEVVILGCIYYLLMEDIFQDVLGVDVKVYSQVNFVVDSLGDYLKWYFNMCGVGEESKFFMIGDLVCVFVCVMQFL